MSKFKMWVAMLPKYVFLIALLVLISESYRSAGQSEIKEESETAVARGGVELPADVIKTYFPEYNRLEQVDTVLYLVKKDDNSLGKLIVTTPLADEIIGFSGNVPLFLAVSPDNRILGLELLENTESPGFVKRIAKTGFFEAWNGKTLEEALELKVDAVSGATMTSDAVKGSVVKAVGFHLQAGERADETDWLSFIKKVLGVLVIVLALFSCFAGKRLKNYRPLLLISSVLVLGFWSGCFVSLALLYGWLLNGVSISGSIIMVAIVGVALLLPLFTGKAFYCYYVCPFGAAQELTGKLCKKKLAVKGIAMKILKNLRKVYLIVIFALLFFGVSVDLTQFEPFSAFMFGVAGRWTIALALTFLLFSLFVTRPWCNYFCPTGQFLEILRQKPEIKPIRRVIIEWTIAILWVGIVFFVLS